MQPADGGRLRGFPRDRFAPARPRAVLRFPPVRQLAVATRERANALSRRDGLRRTRVPTAAQRIHSRAFFGGSRDAIHRKRVARGVALARRRRAPWAGAQDIKVEVTGSNIKRVDGRDRAAAAGDHARGDRVAPARRPRWSCSTASRSTARSATTTLANAFADSARHRLLGRVAARPGLQVHADPAERAPPRELRARRHGDRPQRDPALGDRARRGPEGRRVRDLRHRRDRRRHQLHHAQRLPRRRGVGLLRRHVRRRRAREERHARRWASATSRRTAGTRSSSMQWHEAGAAVRARPPVDATVVHPVRGPRLDVGPFAAGQRRPSRASATAIRCTRTARRRSSRTREVLPGPVPLRPQPVPRLAAGGREVQRDRARRVPDHAGPPGSSSRRCTRGTSTASSCSRCRSGPACCSRRPAPARPGSCCRRPPRTTRTTSRRSTGSPASRWTSSGGVRRRAARLDRPPPSSRASSPASRATCSGWDYEAAYSWNESRGQATA